MSEINSYSLLQLSIYPTLSTQGSKQKNHLFEISLKKQHAILSIAAPQITIGHTYRSSLVFLLLIALPRDLRKLSHHGEPRLLRSDSNSSSAVPAAKVCSPYFFHRLVIHRPNPPSSHHHAKTPALHGRQKLGITELR